MPQQLSLRQIRSRITGIDNIKKVTHAMEMIAAAKLKSVEEQVSRVREYQAQIRGILARALASMGENAHPLLEKRKNIKRAALCVITSDTGLCGVYNSAAIRMAEDYIRVRGAGNVDLVVVGRKAFNYFKKRSGRIAGSFTEMRGVYPNAIFGDLSKNITDLYLSRAVDEAHVIYTRFETAGRSRPVLEKFLGLDHLEAKSMGHIFEGDPGAIVEALLPVYLSCTARSFLLDSYATEQSMRTIAMQEATKNAKELLEGLILARNKVRQANITKEILEISSTAEVLR